MQISAANGWTVDPSNEAAIYLRLPDAVRLNSEESNELNTLISDLSTYIQTTMLGWMNRTVAFSDEDGRVLRYLRRDEPWKNSGGL